MRKPHGKRRVSFRRPSLVVESLEQRLNLATTMYVDFGLGIDIGDAIQTTVGELRDVVNGPQMGGGPDLDKSISEDLKQTPDHPNPNRAVSLKTLEIDTDGDGVDDDLPALADMVLGIVNDALAPFDVNVVQSDTLASGMSSDLSDIHDVVVANGSQDDVYVMVIDGAIADNQNPPDFKEFSDTRTPNDGFFPQLGQPPVEKLDDTVSIVYAANSLKDISLDEDPPFDLADQIDRLSHRLANQVLKKLVQSFDFPVTDESVLTTGILDEGAGDVATADGAAEGQGNVHHALESRVIFTRTLHTSLANTYQTAIDRFGGLRDDEPNGRYDYAYVSGSGAHDQIFLYADNGFLNVTVRSYEEPLSIDNVSDSDCTTQEPGQNEESVCLYEDQYSIDLALFDSIIVDAGLFDDQIFVDGDFTDSGRPLDITIRGSHGNDELRFGRIGEVSNNFYVRNTNGGTEEFELILDGQDISGTRFISTFRGHGVDGKLTVDSTGDEFVIENMVDSDMMQIYEVDVAERLTFINSDGDVRFLDNAGTPATAGAPVSANLRLHINDGHVVFTSEQDLQFLEINATDLDAVQVATDPGSNPSDIYSVRTYAVFSENALRQNASFDAGAVLTPETLPHHIAVAELSDAQGTQYLELRSAAPGDANRDGLVDGVDFNIVFENQSTAGNWDDGDFNGDFVVDPTDLAIWDDNKFTMAGAPVWGDLNYDGQVDVVDIDLMFAALNAMNSSSAPATYEQNNLSLYDFDGDQDLDVNDIDYFIMLVMETSYGDVNLDGVVDSSDLDILLSNWYQYVSSWGDGDLNGDGIVNALDLNILVGNM